MTQNQFEHLPQCVETLNTDSKYISNSIAFAYFRFHLKHKLVENVNLALGHNAHVLIADFVNKIKD